MTRLTYHPATRCLALLLYMAVGVVLPAGAVNCQQDDCDVAVMWGGGCRSGEAYHHAGHGLFVSIPDCCDSPCVDSPIATVSRIPPRRAGDSGSEPFAAGEAIEQPGLPLTLHTIRIQDDFLSPTILSVRSIVLLI